MNNLTNLNELFKNGKQNGCKLFGYILEDLEYGTDAVSVFSLETSHTELSFINSHFDEFLEHKHADRVKISWFGCAKSYSELMKNITLHKTKVLQRKQLEEERI